MEINNSSLWFNYSSTSSVSTTSSTNVLSSFTDLFTEVASSSFIQEMNQYSVQDMGTPPDFSSMTCEEFRAHLLELEEVLGESFSFDPENLTEEQLEAMKAEMEKGPPPPPPMEMNFQNLNLVDYSSLSSQALTSLFDYL